MSLYTAIFGDPNERKIKNYRKEIEQIKKIEEEYAASITTLEQVKAKTAEFQARFADLDHKNEADLKKIREILDETKYEALALHRTACRIIKGKTFDITSLDQIHEASPEEHAPVEGEEGRISRTLYTWNMVPFDVQLMGALALHEGNISEMKTGEGKTLVATLAAYLNALAGLPVHVVTVNDYLAQRDSKEMGIIYTSLGLTVGVIIHHQDSDTKQKMYARNVVYATNNELGFDYLRDNMAIRADRRVMGPLFYAIVDEVDSILVDEARTPLIISAPDSEPTSKYLKFAQMAKMLKNTTHYKIDEKYKTATLTEAGIEEIERMLGIENIYVSTNYNDIHHIENALKAETVYINDVDYLVRNDEILIIDEHTGRVLAGRRYSDGLHQAIEAKEGVTIQQETKTLASVTFQNFFRLYKKLSGMTGTAKTEEEEFYKIYHLEVIVIPTNMPMIREDKSDLLFKNEVGKFHYLVKLIAEFHKVGQPILVGTVSVAKSEYLSNLLTQASIPHDVLNAKQDSREADIVSQAGRFGAVTIATNMAGRGTDIKLDARVKELSGSVKVGYHEYKLGGLVVIGTEKHETRRIDNQLRGRSGRQGDPGLSQFLVSPQDDIMRIFGGDKLFSLFNSGMFASIPADEPLAESGMLTRRINTVQKQVEGRNFDTRKHVLEYDDVLHNHRLAIYSRRNKILEQTNVHEDILNIIHEQAQTTTEGIVIEDRFADWDLGHIATELNNFTWFDAISVDEITPLEKKEEIAHLLERKILGKISELMAQVSEDDFYDFERKLYLQSIDELWMRHIDDMSHLREEVAFEGYAQKQPLVVYKERAYDKFLALLNEIGFKIIKGLVTASPSQQIEQVEIDEKMLEMLMQESTSNTTETQNLGNIGNLLSDAAAEFKLSEQENEGIRVYRADESKTSPQEDYHNVGRNDPCPCGSGKKFKQCHGK